jgi:hypothetical protein
MATFTAPGRIPSVGLTLLIAVAVFDFIASSTALGTSKWSHVVTWSLALVGLSYVGATVLRNVGPGVGRSLPTPHRGAHHALQSNMLR